MLEQELLKARLDRIKHTSSILKEARLGWQGERLDFAEFMEMSYPESREYLRTRLKPLLDGVHVLNEDDPTGVFNRHDLVHLDKVNDTAQYLLDRCGHAIDDTDRNVALAISYLHDIGNNLDRKKHPELGLYLLSRIVKLPEDGAYQNEIDSIVTGIRIHEPPAGLEIANYADLPDHLHKPAIAAAIIGDILDVGRHRLTTRYLDDIALIAPKSIIDINPHQEMSLYGRGSKLNLDELGTKLEFQIDFSAKADPDSPDDIFAILTRFLFRDDKDNVWVPESWYNDHKATNSTYVESYLNTFIRTYADRIPQLCSCLFYLFPALNSFTISAIDEDPLVNTEVRKAYRRSDWKLTAFMDWKTAKGVKTEELLNGTKKLPEIFKAGFEQFLARRNPEGQLFP